MRGDTLGLLHGLPLGVKDLQDTAGLLSTSGKIGRRNHVPAHDNTLVARLRAAGAIVTAKTNVPDMGAGANTRNPVWGATGNPFNPSLQRGRLVRRLGRGAGGGHVAAGHRVGHRRLTAHPGRVVRRGRPAAVAGRGGQRRSAAGLVGDLGAGPDGPRRGRHPADAARQRRHRLARPLVVRATRPGPAAGRWSICHGCASASPKTSAAAPSTR